MLRRLAELDLLRRVEVVSTVSGGSVVGALYALLLKRDLERSERLGRRDFLALVDELTRRVKAGIRRNLRSRLLLNPVALARAMATSHTLAARMARLYERHLFAPVVDELEDVDAPAGRVALGDLRIRPGGRPLGTGIESYNRARIREIRDGEPAVAVPRLVVNATSLNSGARFRFTAVEVGDRHLGHLRRDEAGLLLDRKRLLENRVGELIAGDGGAGGAPGADDITLGGLVRALRASDGARPAVRIRGSSSPLRTAALARWWREGDHRRAPPGWDVFRRALPRLPAALARAEMGVLRQAKLAAWHLRVGRTRENGPITGGRSPREHWRRLLASLEEIDPRLHPRAVAGFESDPRPDRRDERSRRLLDLVLETFWIRSAERASPRLAADWRRLTLGKAVAASAAFPPVFSPLVLPGLYDDAHVSRLALTDGGVYDNTGIVALLEEECDHVIASDAGARFRPRRKGPAGRLAAGARSLGVLRKAVAGFQRARMRERRRVSRSVEEVLAAPARSEGVERGLRQMLARRRLTGLAYFHIGSPRERPELHARTADGRSGAADATGGASGGAGGAIEAADAATRADAVGPPHPAPHTGLDTGLLEGLRTDLDAFGEVEAAALIDRGYETADQYVRSFLEPTLGTPAWRSEEARPRLPEPLPSLGRVHRILRAGSARFFRPLRLFRLERPRLARVVAAAAALAGGAAAVRAVRGAGATLRGVLDAAAGALPWLAALPVAVLLGALAVGGAGLVSGRVYGRMTRLDERDRAGDRSAPGPRR